MPPDEQQDPFFSDDVFDNHYPISVRELSEIHWTPLKVAETASQFLVTNKDSRIIDIGAGVGKFCIAGAHYSEGHFTGIEQRKNFVRAGNKIIKELAIQNAELRHGNFMDIDLASYSGIYFYNSFHENIVHSDALDNKVELTTELYELYTNHLTQQLLAMPQGSRLATYWLSITEIPACYRMQGAHFNDLLKLWVKEY